MKSSPFGSMTTIAYPHMIAASASSVIVTVLPEPVVPGTR
jgi:hypothetical protein